MTTLIITVLACVCGLICGAFARESMRLRKDNNTLEDIIKSQEERLKAQLKLTNKRVSQLNIKEAQLQKHSESYAENDFKLKILKILLTEGVISLFDLRQKLGFKDSFDLPITIAPESESVSSDCLDDLVGSTKATLHLNVLLEELRVDNYIVIKQLTKEHSKESLVLVCIVYDKKRWSQSNFKLVDRDLHLQEPIM